MSTQLSRPPLVRSVGLVEDEPILLSELSFQLRQRGLHIETFTNAAELYRYMATQPLAAVVLDIGLLISTQN